MSNTIKVSVPADDIDALDAARAFFEQLSLRREDSDPGQSWVTPGDAELPKDQEYGGVGLEPHTADQSQGKTTEPADGGESGAELVDNVTGAVSTPEDEQQEGDGSAVELDKDNLPWDGRIHASTKKQTQDGRWKKKRGVDDETRQQVEAELRQLMDAPTPGESATSEPSGAAPPPPPAGSGEPDSEGEPSGAAPPPPPATEPAASGEDMDFPTFLEHVGEAVADQRISWERVNELCSEVTDGAVTKSALLSARTDLIPSVWARIRQELGSNG